MLINKKKLLNIIILFAVAAFFAFVWYLPYIFKGYHPDVINDQLVLARNLLVGGKYSLYNDNGVLISSELVSSFGENSSIGNKLTAYLYSYVFKIFGVLDINGVLAFSISLNALSLFIFSIVVFHFFGLKTAVFFSAVYALLPFNWRNVYALGNYEFAILFLSFFLFLFFLGKNTKRNILRFLVLFASGIFLSLSALAKEAFLVLILIFFLFLAINKKKNLLIPVFSAVFIIFGFFYFPSFFKGDNIYKNVLFNSKPDKELDFNLAGHLFPDYYTFRYDREDFLRGFSLVLNGNEGFIKTLAVKKAAANVYGYKISIFERIAVGVYIISGHLFRFISLEEIGGAFIFGLMVLGFVSLKPKEFFLFKFFNYWLFLSIFIFSFVILVSRSHLMDFGFALALLVALGGIYLSDIFKDRFKLNKAREFVLFFGLLMFFGYHLLLINHVVWGKAYNENMLKLYALEDEVKNKNIKNNEVIVTGLRHDESITFNFISDSSVIVFKPETVKKIISEKKLESVFSDFNIKYALGYSPELLEELKREGKIEVINFDESRYKDLSAPFYKMWLLGLFR